MNVILFPSAISEKQGRFICIEVLYVYLEIICKKTQVFCTRCKIYVFIAKAGTNKCITKTSSKVL